MPIITKPAIEKGTPSSFSLSDKTSLASLIGDSYYSDSSNWKRVVLVYKSSEGNQIKHVIFDATQSSPSGELLLSLKARDNFNIASIIIHDFDGGSFVIKRSLLVVSEFDIALEAVSAEILRLSNPAPQIWSYSSVSNQAAIYGVSFTTEEAFSLTKVLRTLVRPNSGVLDCDLRLTIKSDKDTVLGESIVNASVLQPEGGNYWVEFAFATPIPLQANTMYYCEIEFINIVSWASFNLAHSNPSGQDANKTFYYARFAGDAISSWGASTLPCYEIYGS